MREGVLFRINAVAQLDREPSAGEAMRARAQAGDADSAWMVEQWDEGRLVLARIVLRACAQDDHGEAVRAERVIEGVWLEREELPRVETEIADVAPSALRALATALREQGVAVDDDMLEASFVHVEIDDALRSALTAS